MKLVIIFYMTFICISTYAQQSIGINFSVDRTYRTLKANESSVIQTDVDYRDSIFKPSFHFTIGLNLQKEISNKILLNKTIKYFTSGYESILVSLPPENPGVEMLNTKQIIKREHVSILVSLKYFLTKNKINTFSIFGLSANFPVKTNINSQYFIYKSDRTTSYQTSDNTLLWKFKPVLIFAEFGLGFDIPINNEYSFQINPVYRRAINSNTKSFPKQFLYSSGINFTIYRNF